MTLIDHLENHFGEICRGWKDTDAKNHIRVVSFQNQPFEDIVTYATIGLSNVVLAMPSGKGIRQELIFTAYRSFQGAQIASFLSTLGESISQSRKALARGDVIGPSAPIILGSPLNSIFSAIPMIFQESLAVFHEDVPPTVFVWVIPVHEEEANYIRGAGWEAFEDRLEQNNPELWDLHRTSVIRSGPNLVKPSANT
jgi:hypothetical protein